MEWSFPEQLFPTMLEFRAAYQACQKMSYKEYVSEPRYLFSEYQTYRTVKPLKSEPTLLVYADENGLPYTEERGKVYFDAKNTRKMRKRQTAAMRGTTLLTFFASMMKSGAGIFPLIRSMWSSGIMKNWSVSEA